MSLSLEKDGVNTAEVAESPKPFTEGGKCFDEVQLIFDDEKKLFVSQNFLILSSPVFEVMFKSDFKEKQTMTVNMEGKSYDDVLEFLLCIHPGVKNTVTTSNVLRMAPLAEEYQVPSIICLCTSCMKTWLDTEHQTAQKGRTIKSNVLQARNCLYVLETVVLLNYEDLIAYAMKVVAKFGHGIYNGSCQPGFARYEWEDKVANEKNETCRDVIKECRELFRNFPEKLKCEILSHRLVYYPGDEMKN